MIVFLVTFGREHPRVFLTKKQALMSIADTFISYLSDSLHDQTEVEMEENEETFAEYLNNYTIERRKIDPKLPVYIMQDLNYFALGETITQDLATWKLKCYRTADNEEFLRQCTFRVDTEE